MRYISFFISLCFVPILQASSFGKGDVNGSKPLHISAKDGMKCNQNTHVCTAYNATVSQDGTTLVGREITVYFTEKDDPDHVEAKGNVRIKSGNDYEGWGQYVFFDMQKGKGRLEDKARIKDYVQGREINAKLINFTVRKDDHNKTSIEHADAEGHVKIVTAKDVALGDAGQYDGKTEIMTLTGNVKITNIKGQVNGSKAVMNMKTGENEVFANPSQKQPVELLLRASKDNTAETKK